MAQEIKIHRELSHKNIVKFFASFQDDRFVFIILEICKKKSLMELHKRRGHITEPETRYYMFQLCEGILYLHQRNIIHRDLKLGNIFLSEEMTIKIGDMGLATQLEYASQRRRTLCGTPNYIAPEILVKKGHSLEVDIWSTGCIMYTLLVGKPPFETCSLKETYSKIKKCEYTIPEDKVGPSACSLITQMLSSMPERRPKIDQILEHDFIKVGYMPKRLPSSALSCPPRLTEEQMSFSVTRQPMISIAKDNEEEIMQPVIKKTSLAPPDDVRAQEQANGMRDLKTLLNMLTDIALAKELDKSTLSEDCEHPSSSPIYWISKWVDYSDKYGIGYQLCDNSVGVLYNDQTRMILHEDGEQVQYLTKNMKEEMFRLSADKPQLKKKVSLVNYFKKYMNEHLLKAGAGVAPKEPDQLVRLPFLQTWFRTRRAICLWLSNGSIQINWFESHEKIVLCSKMKALTFLLQNGQSITYSAELITKHGITSDLKDKIKYARNMVKKLMRPSDSTSSARTTTTPQTTPLSRI
ncbi:unnamed protein product [Oikopleura dioica]|uniref:polo kinase n=1 Tax=Oikopleura dioica TaxID=34765 RepID=E4X9Z3_OIKDI|nr:unnamed protein product [Oikopleura dioica]